MNAKDIEDRLDVKFDDDRNEVADTGEEGGDNSGQQGADEAKDSSQQIPNEAHNFEHKGKNSFLDGTGNDLEETLDEEEDDLIDRLSQRW